MMSNTTKFTVFLCLATILNLSGYLIMSGSLKRFLDSPVTRKFSYRSFTSFEKEMTALFHKATNVHHLSATNMTSLMKKVLKDELHFENKLPEKETPIEGNKSTESEKLSKYKGDKFVTHPRASLVPKRIGNIEMEKNVSVKEDEKKGPAQEEKEEIIHAAEVKKPSAEEYKETDPPSQVKKEEQVFPQEEQKSDIKKQEMAAQVEEKKGGASSTVEYTLMKGEAEGPVNPHDFNYVINEPSRCKSEDGTDKDVFLLVMVLSVHENFENRNAIRQSWGSPTEVDGHKVITMFLLAKRSDDMLQKLVLEESEQNRDILMEDFVDTYMNLTLKTIMGMKWMSTFCAQAKFMMKTDDDMYVSYGNIIKYLDQSQKANFMTGYVMHGGPIRNPKSKWYMPKKSYPGSKYPPFCSGTGYILSGDVPPKVYFTSLSTPYLYLEDVYVGICLKKLHIVPEKHEEFYTWKPTYTLCHYRRIFTAHGVTLTEMIQFWKDQTTNKGKC